MSDLTLFMAAALLVLLLVEAMLGLVRYLSID